ncbi:MAG: DUF7151 family protein [Marinobacter sp.]|uniref:DUF7151 family protein n=1 Tax=Marinobacter sp. TaxID=50741 RepID=UPI003F9694DA
MSTYLSFNKTLLASAVAASTLLTSGCWLDSSDSEKNNESDEQEIRLLTSVSNITDNGACTDGGKLISAGEDNNSNGLLDSNEIEQEIQICDDTVSELSGSGLLETTELGLGDDRCSTGGFLVSAEGNDPTIVCNADQNNASDLITSLSATPADPEAGAPYTLEVAVRAAEPDETITIEWTDLTSGKILSQTSKIVNLTAPETMGTIEYAVTVRSNSSDSATGGLEELGTVSVTVMEANTTQTDRVGTPSGDVSVPAEFEQPQAQPQGDFEGALLFAGQKSQPLAVSALNADSPKKALAAAAQVRTIRAQALTSREVAAFVAERPPLGAGSTARAVLENLANQISGESGFNLSNIGTSQVGSNKIVSGSYNLESLPAAKPTDVSNELVQLLGINTAGGTITNLPTASGNEVALSDYRLNMTVIYFDQGTPSDEADDKIILLSSLVAESELSTWENAITRLTSGRNVFPSNATRTPGQQEFTTSATSKKADFLFVVDNSGSMGGEQTALSEAADSFSSVLSSSGLDFSIGTINTSSVIELADDNNDGAFTQDLSEFKLDVTNQGTSGSATETGIYNAEQALQSTTEGDTNDGVVTTEGYPRADASLSVIILSDEPSQYTSRSDGKKEFVADNNLFISRGYAVYALIEPGDASHSQYDDLALSSGGSFGDIQAIADFDALMSEISKNAGGAANSYKLPDNVDASTIEVRKNGVVVSTGTDSTDGWIYRPASNTVLLRGTAVPAEGDKIQLRYTLVETP